VVTEGNISNQVVVVQGDKVVIFNTEENCVEQTWYAGTGRLIKSAVSTLGLFGTAQVIMVVDKNTIVWGDKENKVENCDKLDLYKDVRELVVLDKIHWVIFEDGSVEQLNYFKNTEREDWVESSPVLEEMVILQTRIVQTSSHIVLAHLVENKSTGALQVVRGNVVLDSETKSHTLTMVKKTPICLAKEVVCYDLAQDCSVAMIRTSGTLCFFNTKTSMEEEVTKVPSTLHSSITHTGTDQVAVMGSLSEGGYLQLISIPYRAVVVEKKVKTTTHKGRGMFLVGGKLFLSISSRIMSIELGSHLRGGLDMMLGKLAEPQPHISYNTIPDMLKNKDTNKLMSAIPNMQDIPEYLVLDCIIQVLDTETTEAELQRYLGILFSQNISQPVMSEEVARLSLVQVIELLKVLDTLIHEDQTDIENVDKSVLEWVSLLVTSHYMQLVVSRDKDTLNMVNRMQNTIKEVQESVKMMTDSKVLVHNIMNTKIPPIKNNNQAYCIEIIQI